MSEDEIRAVALLPILLVMAATAYQGFFPSTLTESFSELAILGPNMKVGDYPRELCVNESFTLYLYVRNHEGKVMYYRILAKLGNKSSLINETIPMEGLILAKHERVLMDNETWIRPIDLSISKSGMNLRLVFEAWIYDEATEGFKYHGRWVHLWLNVTDCRS